MWGAGGGRREKAIPSALSGGLYEPHQRPTPLTSGAFLEGGELHAPRTPATQRPLLAGHHSGVSARKPHCSTQPEPDLGPQSFPNKASEDQYLMKNVRVLFNFNNWSM